MTITTDSLPTPSEFTRAAGGLRGAQPLRRRYVATFSRLCWRAALLAATVVSLRAVDSTWNYAVQVSATVTADPPEITLSWVEDTTNTYSNYRPSYTVARRKPGQDGWGKAVDVPTGETHFVDDDVAVGVAYEYRVARTYHDPGAPEFDHVANGYVVSGIGVPFPDHRGKVLLVVEHAVASSLGDRVQRLRDDLMSDGWTVQPIAVDAGDSPTQVREAIRNEYWTGAERARAVFLLGHVPVALAGNYAPDGHEPRPMPCDSYYGDVDGTWVDADGNGVFGGNRIPSDIEMEVGRVDFAEMDGVGTGRSELDLVAQYLDKDHAFRRGELRFGRRALIGDRVGVDRGRAPAAAGYRTFSAFFGPENIVAANTEDNGPDSDRWASLLRRDSYAWAFGSGGGGYGLVAFLGTEGEYKSATSEDLATGGAAGFYLLFGSYFVEWQQPNNLLRAALASATGGLGAAWSGRPNLFLHAMGLGETVGYGVRLSQNNTDLYFSPTNAFSRGVHIAWMGDPTLRLDYPKPVRNLSGTRNGSSVALAWQTPDDTTSLIGYCVYRLIGGDGSVVRLTPAPITESRFTDTTATAGSTYLVRAISRQETPSGTYQNPSEGVIWTDGGAGPTAESSPTAAAATSSLPSKPRTDPGTVKLGFPILFTPPTQSAEDGPRAPTN